MVQTIFDVLYTFFIFLEIILYLYILSLWLPFNYKFKNILITLMTPLLQPIRYLLKKSIFNTPVIDISPIIALVVISFLQNLFYIFK